VRTARGAAVANWPRISTEVEAASSCKAVLAREEDGEVDEFDKCTKWVLSRISLVVNIHSFGTNVIKVA